MFRGELPGYKSQRIRVLTFPSSSSRPPDRFQHRRSASTTPLVSGTTFVDWSEPWPCSTTCTSTGTGPFSSTCIPESPPRNSHRRSYQLRSGSADSTFTGAFSRPGSTYFKRRRRHSLPLGPSSPWLPLPGIFLRLRRPPLGSLLRALG